jgi:hypothetical protein
MEANIYERYKKLQEDLTSSLAETWKYLDYNTKKIVAKAITSVINEKINNEIQTLSMHKQSEINVFNAKSMYSTH